MMLKFFFSKCDDVLPLRDNPYKDQALNYVSVLHM